MAIGTLNSWSEIESGHNKNSGKIEDYIYICMCICVGKKVKQEIRFPHLKE